MRRTELRLLDLPIAVDAPDATADDLFRALASRGCLAEAPGRASLVYELRPHDVGYDVVRLEGSSAELVDNARTIDEAADLIADNLHPWVAQNHPDLLLVHAGVVAWNGVGIVMPGRTHSGKSSLVAALLRAGACYLSDEFAPIDRRGNVHPYPRHLSIRDARGRATRVPPSQVATSIAADPAPVGLVIDTRFVSGASFVPEWRRGTAALLAVADNALVARSRPAYTMEIVAGLAPRVVVLRSDRGDADEAAAAILAAADSIDAGQNT